MEIIKENKVKRNVGLDLIRMCASLFTIAGHFFTLNTPFDGTKFEGGDFYPRCI